MKIIERIFDRHAGRKPRRTIAFAAVGIVIAGSASFAAISKTAASATVPLPAALSGQSLVTTFTPQTLTTAAWADPTNNPGNCPTSNSGAKINAAGWAEIDTTGATNDCRSIQSPTANMPTAPGTTYEALMNFSSFNDWPALWMYGPNWPNQGEIDAVEGGPGESFVTWHQAGNHTIGGESWDNTVVPLAGGPDIQPNTWTTVDISFTTTGVDVYYNGTLYVHIPETVTTGGNDPMYLTISEGSCDADGTDVCNGNSGNDSPTGSVQTQWVREFSSSGGGSTPTPTPTPTTPTPTPTATPTSTPVTIYACEDTQGNVTAITAGTAPTCPTGDTPISWSGLAA